MRIDLARMIRRAGKTRQPYIVVPAITPTKAQEQDLLTIYMRVVREWGRQIPERVMPVYERTLGEGIRDSADDVNAEMETVAAALNRLVITLGPALEDWVVRVEEWHRSRFANTFTPYGVDLATMLGRGDVAQTLQAVLAENLSLIRSLNDQLRNGISGAVFRGLANRTPATEVAREIKNATGIARKRAELIAADQLQKLTGRLDQERQEQVGSRRFKWRHSEKRFPRPEHVARDGKIFRWDSEVGKNDPPGRAIRCGCRAQAIIDLSDLDDEE